MTSWCRWFSSLFLLIACGLPASDALADDVADEADLRFQLGAQAYLEKDYRMALMHFLASNRLAPNHNVKFNIARSYEQIANYPDAYRYYTFALDGETDSFLREKIVGYIQNMAAKVAVLRIETDPPGATIYVERRDLGARGTSPRTLAFSGGTYRIIAELDGYETAELAIVEVHAGQSLPVFLHLNRILGEISVGGAGGEVFLDGEKRCAAPCVMQASPGYHLLRVHKPGSRPFQEQILVEARRRMILNPGLEPLTGSVLVDADEKGALVQIDGKIAGFTPVVVTEQVGKRRVRVSLTGFTPVEQTVDVAADAQVHLRVEMHAYEEVSAASRSAESTRDAPTSVSIVSSGELRAMAYPTIAQAVRGVRGLSISDDSSYETVGFRGLSRLGDYGNRVLVLFDGHSTNDNWMGSSYVGYDARTDLDDVEQIEIIRGPGSALYGTGAFSGVINLVTRRRVEKTGGSVGLSASGDGVARARGLVTAKLGENSGAWISIAAARSAGRDVYIEDFAGPSADGSYADGQARGLDAINAGTISGRYYYKDFTVQWFAHSRKKRVPNAAYESIFNDGRTQQKDSRGFVEARYEPYLGKSVQLLTRAHVNHYRFVGTYAYPEIDGGMQTDRFWGSWAGIESRIIVSISQALRITVGGEGQRHFLVNQTGENSKGVALNRNDPYSVGAGYLLADAKLSDRIRLAGGVRLDWYSTFGTSINPRISAMYRPYEAGAIKAIVGRAFRAPSAGELYYNDGGLTQVASPGLRPETIYSPELEWTHKFSPVWTGLIAGYFNYVDGLIVPRGGSGEEPLHYANSDASVLTTGTELELRREWHQGFMLAATYSYQKARYVGDKGQAGETLREVPNVPEHMGSLRGVVPLIPSWLSVASRLSLEAPRWDRNDHPSDAPQRRTDSAVIWDMVLSGDSQKHGLAYAVGLYNAFDWKYSVPVSADFKQKTNRQSGRTFLLSMSSSF